ncbi:hypothetical protein CYY_004890 [Polysphondylium violaceum]|uniref:SNF2-related domain-containing protein n=1 Tax=Polysphondylium violaceum TaxID=133409 RepID=A0A8J4Q4I9_9MYCE|nr:hypothetical protein CYY_004890 [Polysphondylium violaceum]
MKRNKARGFITPYKTDTPLSTTEPNTTTPKFTKPKTTSIPTTTISTPLSSKSTTATTSTTTTNKTTKAPTTKARKTTTKEFKNESKESIENKATGDTTLRYHRVMWCNLTTKKHKTYNDGYLSFDEPSLLSLLMDDVGKEIGKSKNIKLDELYPDFLTKFSGKEVIIGEEIKESDFRKSTNTNIQYNDTSAISSSNGNSTSSSATPDILKAKFVGHDNGNATKVLKSRNDPNEANAFVLYQPPKGMVDAEGKPVTWVVVDPFLANQLRPHQKIGVQFLFNAVIGMHEQGKGAILADQMGLGKTLQTLTLVWTMITQSLYGKKGILKKVVIVTPATLVGNWKKEINRWFGSNRLDPVTLSDSATKSTKEMLHQFITTLVKPVLIISYEQCRTFASIIEDMSCDLLICDEGHRLKNSLSKTNIAVTGIKTERRIILTGTPIQNDLGEFYSMVDFCNPGCLGSISQFKREFINPIMQYRDTSKSSDHAGYRKSLELANLTQPFILRRKSNILEQYLPPKTVYIIFCPLSTLQATLYKRVLNSSRVQSIFSAADDKVKVSGQGSLPTITLLKKLCNSVSLIANEPDLEDLCKSFDKLELDQSGKLLFIKSLIGQLIPLNERLVLVSNYTQTLDVFERLCGSLKVDFLRLDGQVDANARQPLVDKFNESKTFKIFLLSAKAGGVGINLIGGNHIVLFDPDWNPAIDIQAMERVWREGQTKPVSIYRLFSTGTIEEKIYQRQLMKESISNNIIDKSFDNSGSFSVEDLKDIFSLNQATNSDTHDLLQCKCGKSSNSSNSNSSVDPLVFKKRQEIFKKIQHIEKWDHHTDLHNAVSANNRILGNIDNDLVSFVFVSKKLNTINQEFDEQGTFSLLDTEQDIVDEEEQDGNQDNDDIITPSKSVSKRKTTPTKTKATIIDDTDDIDNLEFLDTTPKKRMKNNHFNDEDLENLE